MLQKIFPGPFFENILGVAGGRGAGDPEMVTRPLCRYLHLKGNSMVGRSTRPTGPLLKLFLSPSTISMQEAIFQANLALPKHVRNGSFDGVLVAKQPTPLGGKLLLLALAEVQGPKLGLPHGVLGLDSHETRPLRDVVFLLDSDSLKDWTIGVNYRARKLHPSVFGHATVNSLRVLGKGWRRRQAYRHHCGS